MSLRAEMRSRRDSSRASSSSTSETSESEDKILAGDGRGLIRLKAYHRLCPSRLRLLAGRSVASRTPHRGLPRA